MWDQASELLRLFEPLDMANFYGSGFYASNDDVPDFVDDDETRLYLSSLNRWRQRWLGGTLSESETEMAP